MASRHALNRSEVVYGLHLSEERFLRELRTALSVFVEPMSSGLLSDGEAATLFRSFAAIRDTHGLVKVLLDDVVSNENVSQSVLKLSRGLQNGEERLRAVYLPYLTGHAGAMRLLDSLGTRPDVVAFMRAAASRDERVRGVSLADLLELPVVRLREYRDAFHELVVLTDPADPVYEPAARTRDLFNNILRDGAAAAAGASAPAPSPVAAVPTTAIPTTSAAPPVMTSSASAAALGSSSSSSMAARSTISAAADSLASAPVFTPGVSSGIRASSTTAPPVDDITVARAKAEGDDLQRRLDAGDTAAALARSELTRTLGEADRALALRELSDPAEREAMREALSRLDEEERALYDRLARSDNRDMFESFLRKRQEMQAEEERLMRLLDEHETTLSQLRERLANPPESVLPAEPAKRQLYVAWKTALRDREEILRQARARKHKLMRDLREQHETQIILLEMQRRAAVDGLREAVDEEKKKADAYRAELATLDTSIEDARQAMRTFRKEFEDLRVALLVDRMAKSSQVATLAQRRKQLEEEAQAFREQVESARQRVAAEEASKWEARLAAEKDAGERRLEEERRKAETRIQRVREDMTRSFEDSFRPLLEDAERRHRAEVARVTDLQRKLSSKEAELRDAEESARRVGMDVDEGDVEGGTAENEEDETVHGGGGSAPQWKLEEFEELKRYVTEMWERLEVPDEDVVAFLSECDLLAPFDGRVLEMYQDMYRRLTDGDLSAPAPAPAPTPSYSHAHSGSSSSVSSPPSGGHDSSSSSSNGAHGRSTSASRSGGNSNGTNTPGLYGTVGGPSPMRVPGSSTVVPVVAEHLASSSSSSAGTFSRQIGSSSSGTHSHSSGTPGSGSGPSSARPGASSLAASLAAGRRLGGAALPPSMGGPGSRRSGAPRSAGNVRVFRASEQARVGPSHTRVTPTSHKSTMAASDGKEEEDAVGLAGVPLDLRDIARGFRIVTMAIRDGEGPTEYWKVQDWGQEMWSEELTARMPAAVLRLGAVARRIEFHSDLLIRDFNIVQSIQLHGSEIECWSFHCGLVIPNSTNEWEQTIVAADEAEMIPASVLSGNLVIETQFRDGDRTFGRCRVRIVYE